MKGIRFGFASAVLIGAWIWVGCATGSDAVFGGGGGGVGGSGVGGGGDGGESAASTTGGSPTSGATGTSSTASGYSATSSTSSTTSSSTTSTSSVSASSSTGGGCGPMQHLCGGVCAGNTPATGCFQSVSCSPCPAAPANGVSTCSAAGACDFTCNGGYGKSGNACVCASQCCTNADCAQGETCSGGQCQPPPCDGAACIAQCLAMCGAPGFCIGDTCTCAC